MGWCFSTFYPSKRFCVNCFKFLYINSVLRWFPQLHICSIQSLQSTSSRYSDFTQVLTGWNSWHGFRSIPSFIRWLFSTSGVLILLKNMLHRSEQKVGLQLWDPICGPVAWPPQSPDLSPQWTFSLGCCQSLFMKSKYCIWYDSLH